MQIPEEVTLPTTWIISISTGKKTQTIQWVKRKNVDGYVIQISSDKNFGDFTETKIRNATITSKNFKLKKGQTYYLRVCTYVEKNGTTNYSEWSTTKSTVIPTTTAIKSVVGGSKKLTVKWKKKNTYVTGYQLEYSKHKKFKNSKILTVKKKAKTTIGKLKNKKKYYVRIRTFVKMNGEIYYSAWSEAKSVKTK